MRSTLNPRRIDTRLLVAGPTNSRWASLIWRNTPRRDGIFVDTPWFTIVLLKKET